MRIALVGNSHAGHWLPALIAMAEARGWQITTFLASECNMMDRPQAFRKVGATEGCESLGRWMYEKTAGTGFDLIVTSQRTGPSMVGIAPKDQERAATATYRRTLTKWVDAGDRVLVIRDTPYVGRPMPDCVGLHADNLAACDGPRAERTVPDPQATAAKALGSRAVTVADLTGSFCDDQTCYSTIGGVIVYFDGSHLTATFSRSLAPQLQPYVLKALG